MARLTSKTSGWDRSAEIDLINDLKHMLVSAYDQCEDEAVETEPDVDYRDMSERIMDALCENGQGDFLLLRDDEIREWWAGITKKRAAARRKAVAAKRRAELREGALKKLTAEERKVLGL